MIINNSLLVQCSTSIHIREKIYSIVKKLKTFYYYNIIIIDGTRDY